MYTGKRVTKAFPDRKQAAEWALIVEAERDRQRDEETTKAADEVVVTVLATVRRLVKEGRLTDSQRAELLEIAST
jgi:hypothetical protein